LNVAGNVTFNTGSSFVVETQSNGVSDRLTATGAVTIQSGVAAHITPLGLVDSYGRLSHYTILSGSSVAGTFATVDSSLAFLTPHLTYAANAVQLDLVRNDITFESMGVTANQKSVGRAVEAGGWGSTLYDLLVIQDAAGSRAAFDALSGEAYSTISAGLIDLGESLRTLRPRSPSPYRDEYSVWSKAFGGDASASSDTAADLSSTRSGVLFGADSQSEGLFAGGSFGFLSSTMEIDERASTADISTISLEGHAGMAIGQFSARAGVEYAMHTVETSRAVVFTGLNSATTADFNASSFGASGEIAWALRWPYGSADPNAFLEPFASLTWQRVSMDEFSETGGAAALTSTADDRGVLFARIGARGDVTISAVTLAGSLALRSASGDTDAPLEFRLASGSPFEVRGIALDTSATELNLSASMKLFGGKASLSYLGNFGDQWEGTTASASWILGF
jgi:outer membrane autotransporter protein